MRNDDSFSYGGGWEDGKEGYIQKGEGNIGKTCRIVAKDVTREREKVKGESWTHACTTEGVMTPFPKIKDAERGLGF